MFFCMGLLARFASFGPFASRCSPSRALWLLPLGRGLISMPWCILPIGIAPRLCFRLILVLGIRFLCYTRVGRTIPRAEHSSFLCIVLAYWTFPLLIRHFESSNLQIYASQKRWVPGMMSGKRLLQMLQLSAGQHLVASAMQKPLESSLGSLSPLCSSLRG